MIKININTQPHCDMFSYSEACPECGNTENESINTCNLCGCCWEVNGEIKIVLKHGKLYKG